MGAKQQSGFTIIEVILFLAISGGLLFALLIGVNSSINQQRYRDTVVSLVNKVQSEYLAAQNTSSTRDNSWSCDTLPAAQNGAGEQRGTTDCLIVGRLVAMSGGTLSTTSIIAYDVNKSAVEVATGDVEALTLGMKLMPMQSAEGGYSEFTTEWGAELSSLKADGTPAGVDGKSFTVAIIRSPKTGAIITFIDGTRAVTAIDGSFISADKLKNNLQVCIESRDLVSYQPQALIINANSANSSGAYSKTGMTGC